MCFHSMKSGYDLKLVPEKAMHKRKYVEGAEFSYAVYDLKDVGRYIFTSMC